MSDVSGFGFVSTEVLIMWSDRLGVYPLCLSLRKFRNNTFNIQFMILNNSVHIHRAH